MEMKAGRKMARPATARWMMIDGRARGIVAFFSFLGVSCRILTLKKGVPLGR
jgi:hypothetical protein